jgi:hypothetical protein
MRLWAKGFRAALRDFRAALSVYQYRPVILHQPQHTEGLPDHVLFPACCWRIRKKVRKPEDLAILQIHNRPYKTLLERNLDYLGIKGSAVIRVNAPKWRNTIKITEALRFASECHENYILFCDSDDAILTGDPRKAVDLLCKSKCDMLISATAHRGYEHYGMPELEEWATKVAAENGYHSTEVIHLNSGVYVAQTHFLVDFLTEALKFMPRGDDNEQPIFRLLHRQFYPRVKVDYSLELAVTACDSWYRARR